MGEGGVDQHIYTFVWEERERKRERWGERKGRGGRREGREGVMVIAAVFYSDLQPCLQCWNLPISIYPTPSF